MKKIILSCEKCGSRNYSSTGKKKDSRLELRKFCKYCNEHTVHRETK